MAEQLSGVQAESLNLDCYCASGGGYLGGGAPAPRYQGPLERLSREAGRPMGPSTPAVFFSKLCCFRACSFVRIWHLVREIYIGLLLWDFYIVSVCPLSFGPCKGSLSSRQFVREMFAFGRFSICKRFFFVFFIFLLSLRDKDQVTGLTHTLTRWTLGGALWFASIFAALFSHGLVFFFTPFLCYAASSAATSADFSRF